MPEASEEPESRLMLETQEYSGMPYVEPAAL